MGTIQTTASGSKAATGDAAAQMTRRWKPILAFFLFVCALSLAGGLVFQRYKESLKKDKQNELAGIGELKIRQITNWIVERKGDAESLTHDPLFVAEVERWLQGGGLSDGTRARLNERLTSMQQAYADYGYTSIALFDRQGKLRLSSRSGDVVREHEKPVILESMRSGKATLSDMHSTVRGGERVVELELVAPVFVGTKGKKQAIGGILFRADPYRFLFPLIQRWPTPSQSAENLLVRRDGDDVLFLNELRHLKNTALAMRLPLSRRELPAVMAVLGQAGLIEGIDYRGVPVVGVLHKVPGTQWAMVSKIDRAEIYAPIDSLRNWIFLLLLLLAGAGGGVAAFWWKKQRQYVRALKERHAQKIEHEVLMRHLDYLTKFSNDIILLLNGAGRLISFNDRAVQAYGYTVDELSSLNIDDLRVKEASLAHDERIRQIDRAGGAMVFESVHRRKSGEHIPVESSVRTIEMAGERYYQVIIRDISERKKAESQVLRQKRFIRQIIDSDPNMIMVKDADGRYLLANEAMAKSYGQTTAGIVGKCNADFIGNPELLAAYDHAGREVLESRQERVALEAGMLADGRKHLFHTIRKPLVQDDGSVSVLTIAMDITDLKEAELRFENERTRLRTLLKTMSELVWLKDVDGIYLACNSQFERFFGAREADIVGKTDYDFVDAELADFFRQKDREAMFADKACVNEETVTYADTGERVLLETVKTPVRDEEGILIGVMGIARDITERKRVEEELRFKNTLLTIEHEASIEGVLIIDRLGNIVSCNHRFVGMWGIAEDIIASGSGGRVMQAMLEQLAESNQLMEKVCHLALYGSEVSRGEIELRDGRVFECFTTPMIGPQQERYGRIWYFRDLTEQKVAARDLADSYAKLQQLSLRMENAREDERAKIALNLHDEMGATLAAMKMRVAWLASKLPEGMPLLTEEAAQISELVSGGIQTMHRIVSELRPDLIGDLGLAAAIADYVKKFCRHANIECTLILPEAEFMLGDEHALALFRILQESLNNVVKHARASRVSIIFTEQDHVLSMEIGDDGIGFDVGMHREQSFGLLGIRERALMLGGKARVSSAPGKGTRISVSIPYPARRISDPEPHHA
ncbi:MAG TPA: PAS domain S-box protein [Sideroxyarcus sp.]|nr:PAS domain S-box protein [Sideroxyarcus sp.]